MNKGGLYHSTIIITQTKSMCFPLNILLVIFLTTIFYFGQLFIFCCRKKEIQICKSSTLANCLSFVAVKKKFKYANLQHNSKTLFQCDFDTKTFSNPTAKITLFQCHTIILYHIWCDTIHHTITLFTQLKHYSFILLINCTIK